MTTGVLTYGGPKLSFTQTSAGLLIPKMRHRYCSSLFLVLEIVFHAVQGVIGDQEIACQIDLHAVALANRDGRKLV